MAEFSSDWVRIGEVSRALGISPSRVRQLADEGAIPSRRTSGGHRLFDVAAVRQAQALRSARRARGSHPRIAEPADMPAIVRTISLVGADEAAVWHDLRSTLALPERSATTIMTYAFTEMLNNAIDHSGSPTAVIAWWSLPTLWRFTIADDGAGVFSHLRDELRLQDLFAAIQELTKGRVTTAPQNHTGEGIFFVSKAVDVFTLESSGLSWTVDNLRDDHAVGVSPVTTGTHVSCEIDPAADRRLAEVFAPFTDDDFAFSRTRTVVRLFELGVRFVSRSEAKRLLNGLDRFKEVEIDFGGVIEVGQGFVDELVRVWPSQHPGTAIRPVRMNEAVEFMIRRGLPREPRGEQEARPLDT